MIKYEGRALLLCCGLKPAQRRITPFSRPREHMWLVQHMDWVTLLFFFFSFFQEGDMARVCSWNMDLGWIGLRLSGSLPDFLTPPRLLLFLGKIKSAPQTWNSSRPHPWPPNPTPRAIHCILPKRGATVSSFPFFSEAPTPLLFILDLLPFPETLRRNTCVRFELSPLFFPELVATFRLFLWCGCVSERVQLGFFYCAIIPQVPQRPSVDTWRIYDKLERVN